MTALEAPSVIRRWREDPVTFVRDCFQVEPDAWQVELLRAFPEHKRLASVACKGPGKTAALAWMGWNFLATRPHCKVPCTSITGGNLADGLWAEFSKWQKRSPLLMRAFQWTKTRIQMRQHPETWFASARSWAHDADPTQQANTLAGIHEDFLLFLLDEVSEYPDGVVSAAEAALTGGIETKLVMMGNATRTSGPLYRACTADKKLWFIVRISGDPDDPKRSPRIDIEEARRQIAKYGRDSYVVKVNILGEFPDRQADKLLGPLEVAAAMDRTVHESVYMHAPRVLGVDVARFGDDDAVFTPRRGAVTHQLKTFHGLDNVELAEQLMRSIQRWDADMAFIDETGNGAGVLDICRHRPGFAQKVQGVQFGMRAMESNRFENRRAEMHWEAAEWVKKHGGCLPNDSLLSEELCAPIFWFDKKGRICLEPKDDIKARIGRSPDRADSLVLTFAGPVVRQTYKTEAQRTRAREATDFDPFSSFNQDRQEPGGDFDPFAEGRT